MNITANFSTVSFSVTPHVRLLPENVYWPGRLPRPDAIAHDSTTAVGAILRPCADLQHPTVGSSRLVRSVITTLSGSRRVFGRPSWRWKSSSKCVLGNYQQQRPVSASARPLRQSHSRRNSDRNHKVYVNVALFHYWLLILSLFLTFGATYRFPFLTCCAVHWRCNFHFHARAVREVFICGTIGKIEQIRD